MVTDSFWDPYDEAFFRSHRWGEALTAYRIGFYAWELWEPRSVIDIGCAVGLMLRGVYDASNFTAEVQGVEGAPAIERMMNVGTEIPLEQISPFDLRNLHELAEGDDDSIDTIATRVINSGIMDAGWMRRGWDLAICTEVGEHLPPECADPLVHLVTSLAPRVLWSAAEPDQGGTQHLNEQPLNFWQQLFEAYGFAFDEGRTGDLLNRLGPISSEPWYRRVRIYERVP